MENCPKKDDDLLPQSKLMEILKDNSLQSPDNIIIFGKTQHIHEEIKKLTEKEVEFNSSRLNKKEEEYKEIRSNFTSDIK